MEIKKIPTGVADFDSITNGGLPAGSVVLLLGEAGAGQNEFVYTSASKLLMVKEKPQMRSFLLGDKTKNSVLPEKVCYITFTRSKEDILNEISLGFNEEFRTIIERHSVFSDFSALYFKDSIIPRSWTVASEIKFSLFTRNNPDSGILHALVRFLNENAPNSQVIIDSLTDLIAAQKVPIEEIFTTVKGLQRAAKMWKGLVYLLLTRDILSKREQQILIDSVDGTIVFEWGKSTRTSHRRRYMYVEKFLTLMPHLEESRLARFITKVGPKSGFVVVEREYID